MVERTETSREIQANAFPEAMVNLHWEICGQASSTTYWPPGLTALERRLYIQFVLFFLTDTINFGVPNLLSEDFKFFGEKILRDVLFGVKDSLCVCY
ncbi:hypothetical protein NPIL_700691 [Nephila pilipes]|uniref:Uncharacterized protein n=1 Tax=Nephila pilipes TaxID=299642 RepID=A0A8X6MXF4_NEPPI|nr:hypothetical protein NPIL_700691 [Nephila pilipes]